MQDISGSWEGWKSQLGQAVKVGERMNLSTEEMAQRAEQIGDLLASQVDPKSPEQKVLQELWQAADDQEQQTLAGVIIKLVSESNVH